MATYQFPVFATEMLTAQLERLYGNDFNYAAVLKAPCWQNLQPLWERIIHHTFSITREHLKTPKFDALDAFTHPDIHDDFVYIRAVFIKTKKIACMSKIHDFSIYDLTNPEPLKLRVVLSGIVNFALFVEERRVEFNVAQQEVRLASEQLAAEVEKNAVLARELEELRAQEAAQKPEADKVLAEAAASERRGQAKMKEAQSYKQQIAETQHKYNDLVQQVQQSKAKLQAGRLHKEQLKNSIAPESPSKLQGELVQLEQQLADIDQLTKQEELGQVQMQQRLDDWSMVHERLRQAVSKLEKVYGKLEQKKQASRELKQAVGAVKDMVDSATRLQVEVDGLSCKKSDAVAQRDKLTSEAKAEVENAMKQVESIRGERDVAKTRVKRRQAKINDLDKQIKTLEEEKRVAQAKHEAEMRQLESAAYAIRDELFSCKSAIEAVLQQAVPQLPNCAFPEGFTQDATTTVGESSTILSQMAERAARESIGATQ